MISRVELSANFERVEALIRRACEAAGRRRDSVTLVAVSKRHPPEVIRLAWELGHRHFGENYAQELRDKHAALADCPGLTWHAIGPVQTKNAKYVAKAAGMFHALDRAEVAEALSQRRSGAPLPCLLEVNVAGQDTKAGVPVEAVAELAERVRRLPHLELVGLTTMPPLVDEPEANRPHFAALAALARGLGLPHLSMGTTSDFEVAIAEGATLVRIGTALFGDRPG